MPSNSALMHDDLLVEAVLALEGEKAARPDAFEAISAILEACIIHDEVWIDPLGGGDGGGGIRGKFLAHPILAGLVREGALRRAPAVADLDARLSELGVDYDMTDFTRDLRFTTSSFSVAEASEGIAYELASQILTEVPSAFGSEWLTEPSDPTAYEKMVQVGLGDARGKEGTKLQKLGFTEPELITLEGWNGQGRALSRFAGLLGLNLYITPRVTPHILGACNRQNGIARRAYERLAAKAEDAITPEVGSNSTTYHKIPPVVARTLELAKGESSALVDAVLTMRYELRGLRSCLAQFEAAWVAAATVGDRKRLERDLDGGIKAISDLAMGEQDRLLYRVWDLVKDPTKILQAMGDLLVARGRREAAIGRVQGLRAFWKATLDSPTEERTQILFRRIVPRMAEQRTWKVAEGFCKRLEATISDGVWIH